MEWRHIPVSRRCLFGRRKAVCTFEMDTARVTLSPRQSVLAITGIPKHDSFAAGPADSIDYAIMEKAPKVAVAPVGMGWSDVGSWDALYAIGNKDADGNVSSGAVRIDAGHGNLIHATAFAFRCTASTICSSSQTAVK
jgi:mannose-1-phosphate guanylyltransferase